MQNFAAINRTRKSTAHAVLGLAQPFCQRNNSSQLASTERIPDCHLGTVTVPPTANSYSARLIRWKLSPAFWETGTTHSFSLREGRGRGNIHFRLVCYSAISSHKFQATGTVLGRDGNSSSAKARRGCWPWLPPRQAHFLLLQPFLLLDPDFGISWKSVCHPSLVGWGFHTSAQRG